MNPQFWLSLLVLGVGVVLLIKGANWLVDGAVALARALGLSTLFIGLTIVAFGTSAPELAVNIAAGVADRTDLSFGNVVGSNIANIGLVVGLGALAAPIGVHSRVVRMELPFLIAVSALATWLVASQQGVNNVGGLVLLFAFACFFGTWVYIAMKSGSDPLADEVEAQTESGRTPALGMAVTMLVVGLIMLAVGGELTQRSAVRIASLAGLSNALIGMTIVAIATSLPEVFTVLIAARRGQADLAVGNVVGSNVFNLLLVLPVTTLVAKSGVPLPDNGLLDMGVMCGLTIALLLVALPSTRVVNRLEGAGLLLVYVAYMTWSVLRELLAKGGAP